MSVEWGQSIMVPIFNVKGGITNCIYYRAVNFLEHEKKVVGRVLGKRLCIIVTVDEMQFGFMPEKESIDTVLILRIMQEEYHAKVKMYMCFVEIEKVFDT